LGEEGKEGAPETLRKKKSAMGEGGAEGVSEQHTWSVSTSESALWERVHKLAGDVKACVDGRDGTKVEVDGSAGVRDVVDALRTLNVPNVTATWRGTENRKENGLDVVVVVEGPWPKETVRFVARVDVVPRRVEDDGGEVEIAGRVWKRRNLRATKYKDGTTNIARAPTVQAFVDMSKSKTPAYFIDERSGNMYYNRHVDVSESGVSPAGWGLPTDADVRELVMHYHEDPSSAFYNGGRSYYGPAAAALTDRKGDFKAEMTGYITERGELAYTDRYGLAGVASLWNRGKSDVWWAGDGGSGCFEVTKEGVDMRDEWYGPHQYEGNAIRLLKKKKKRP
jgi:hypothetical protein